MIGSRQKAGRLILNGVDDDALDYDPYRYVAESSSGHMPTAEAPASSDTLPAGRDSKFSEEGTRAEPVVRTTAPSTSPPSSSHVNPVTVPVRTSSNNALVNGDSSSPQSNKKSPRKHRSMASVPEEQNHRSEIDERAWLGQGKQNRHTAPALSQTGWSQQSNSMDRSTSAATVPVSSLTQPDVLRGVGSDLINGYAGGWTPEKENILRGPFDYLESHPGKDVRTQMLTAFDNWLRVPASSLEIIAGVITMLHTASLLIDDVEDNSQLRRGVPVAHSIFGTAQTINSANYIYFCALQEILKLNNPEAMKIYTEELLNLHRGQGMDLFWRDTLTCPSEDDYLEMVGNKTGGLFRLAIKLMCAESPTQRAQPTDYVPLVNTIGLLFQILDDYKNLSDTTYTANKGLCEDLTEGKFSFPIIHAIRADPANLVLINILKQKTSDDEVKRYAVAYMDRAGSFAYTRRVLRGLTKKALQLVDDVDSGRGRAEGVREILERLRVDRNTGSS